MIEKKEMYYPTARQSWGIVGLAICSMLIFLPVNIILNNILGKDFSFLVYYLLALGVPFAFAHTKRNRRTGIGNYDFSLGSFRIIILIGVSTIAIQMGIISPVMGLLPMPDFMQKIFLEMANQNGVFGFIAIVVAAPVLEELIFRGIILDGLLKRHSPLKSIIISSVLFGMVHLNPWQFIGGFIFGLFSGWIYYRTRKLSLSIFIHFVNNLFAFAGFYFFDAESMIYKSQSELYGGLTNLILITVGAVLVSVVGVFLLKEEFNSSKTDSLQQATRK
jgi:uncharacterized protein